MEEAVRPMLRDLDRWIARPGRDEYELYDVGAEAARGEFLFGSPDPRRLGCPSGHSVLSRPGRKPAR
jgi:hypothetical protein